MDSAATTLADAAARLADISDTPRLDAELLMAHALGMERSAMLPRLRDLSTPANFSGLLQRRLAHEPIAYIIGHQPFWDIDLRVTPDVLIPRADSETLIQAAIEHFERGGPSNILDLGTGSGAMLLAALSAFPGAKGMAIDASAKALAVAADNANRLGFEDRANFLHRSWHDAGWQEGLDATFDLILCNPPYVETNAELAPQVRDHEPALALFAGADGLDDYRALIPQIPALLATDGLALFEIGKGQEAAVTDLAKSAGLAVREYRDLAGIVRALGFSHRTSG